MSPSATESFGPPADFFIVESGSKHAYTYCPTLADAQAKLDALQAADPNRFTSATIELADRMIHRIERELLDEPVRRISLDDFCEARDVLPPREWTSTGGIERFNMVEFTRGRITSQYVRAGDLCGVKNVADGDPTTYFDANDLAALRQQPPPNMDASSRANA